MLAPSPEIEHIPCMPVDAPNAKIRWDEADVPVSTDFDDPYYARQDGLAESRFVFLDGNQLTERFVGADHFTIAELGFGTGLNFLAALELWRRVAAPGAVLEFVTFERFPMTGAEMTRALAQWPELDRLRAEVMAAWSGQGADIADARLRVIIGDARDHVADWEGQADAWFLDGFAPARNPEMWEPSLLADVFERTRPGGSFATYSAAGSVRRALQGAGFEVIRSAGFGHKREMLRGHRLN